MKKVFNLISLIFLFALIIYLPFAEVLGNLLEWKTKINPDLIYWITRWYGFAAVILFVAATVVALSKKQKFSKTQIVAWLLFALGFLSIFLFSPSVSRGIEGFRVTLFGLVFYIFAREVTISDKWQKNLVNTYLFTASFIAFWALLERFFPLKYLSVWGLINPEIVFGYGWHSTGSLMQSTSLIGGPNQLASYLLPAIFLLALRIQNADNRRMQTVLYSTFSILCLIVIFLASSRSAIVGLIVGLFVLLCTQKDKVLRAVILFGLGVLVILSFWLIFTHPQYKDVFTHGASQMGHVQSLKVSFEEMKNRVNEPMKLFFGAGIGSAGPLAIKYGGIISESWFLQILLELGIVGLLLYILFFYFVGQELWRKKETGLFYGFIAVLVTSLFLHTLSDNPALTYTLFVLIGLKLSKETNG